jgi:uncharacterized protein YndB with AHSA1/START domain
LLFEGKAGDTMKVNITTTIDAPAENIWKTIRSYDNVESFNPLVTSSTITGTDEGSERVCQVQFGDQQAELFENLDLVDEENKTIKISVTKAPPPFGGQQITFQVKSFGENKAELLISTEVADGNDQAAKGLEDVFQMMAEGLKKLHEKEVIV